MEIAFNPPLTVQVSVISVQQDGAVSFDPDTHDWSINVFVRVAAPEWPQVDGVQLEEIGDRILHGKLLVTRASIEAHAGKSDLTEGELNATVHALVQERISALASGIAS